MPFSDVHLQLHAIRATELQTEAATHLPRTHGFRPRLGWLLVELGLRLVEHPTRARIRPV
ncbi:hypothetical protein [Streptomyces sp. NBC_01716]|uniref:hypothetical protein n=1 Tax=Streptomyces sp. NBC_01716 TaxID=2975917 RepID=UPI002E2F192F|nr:hypothetical protein [Streptomyces sp. NBC_01716]